MLSGLFLGGLYALHLSGFLLIGFFIPNLSGAFWVIAPLILSIIIGYISKSFETAYKIMGLGLIASSVISLLPFGALSTFISEEELAGMSITWLSFFVTQVMLTFVGVGLGLIGKELRRAVWPPKKQIKTYEDFTSESMTRTGVSEVRIIGMIPEELVEWMQEEIEARSYVNLSHIVETALRQLRLHKAQKTNRETDART